MLKQELQWGSILKDARLIFGESNPTLYKGFSELFGGTGNNDWLSLKKQGISYFQICNRSLVKQLEKVQDSYHKLPPNCLQPHCSRRNHLAIEVLNEQYISKSTAIDAEANEESSFSTKPENDWQSTLCALEDKRFELDVMICRLEALSRSLQMQYDTFQEKSKGRMTLTAVEERLLLQLYGNQGPEVMDLLVSQPFYAIPVVLPRLRAKWTDWRNVRCEMHVHWEQSIQENRKKAKDYNRKFLVQNFTKVFTVSLDFLWEEMNQDSSDPMVHGKHDEYTQRNRIASARQKSLKFKVTKVEEKLSLLHRLCVLYAETRLSVEEADTVKSVWSLLINRVFSQGPDEVEQPSPEPPLVEGNLWEESLLTCLQQVQANPDTVLPEISTTIPLKVQPISDADHYNSEVPVLLADFRLYVLFRLIQIFTSHMDYTSDVKQVESVYLEVCRKHFAGELNLPAFGEALEEEGISHCRAQLVPACLDCLMTTFIPFTGDTPGPCQKLAVLFLSRDLNRTPENRLEWMHAYEETALACLEARFNLCTIQFTPVQNTLMFANIAVYTST